MKLLDAKINWYEESDNSPTFELLIDKFPDRNLLRYQEKNGIYYAELEGFVSFFSYSGPDKGFGGRKFPITMMDGSKKELIGPWSSRAGAVNSIGFGPCVDASITKKLEDFKRGYTFFASAVTLDIVKQAAVLAKCNLICETNQNARSNLGAQQCEAFNLEKNTNFSDTSIFSRLKYPVEGDITVHPFTSQKCVCLSCKSIRVGDAGVKKGKTCRTCAAEQYKKDKTYPKDWDQK